MLGKEIFKIWSPIGVSWSAWVRPVPFIYLNEEKIEGIAQLEIPPIFYLNGLKKDTAIFLDLPDYRAIEEGLALASLGWRPVPLYNGCAAPKGAAALSDNTDIEAALIKGAKVLEKIAIPFDAPPVFLLDSGRLNMYKADVSVFDNSWDLYAQDIPSAEFFIKSGINKIIVKGKKIHRDLAVILNKFQKPGISVYFTKGDETPKKVNVRKPLFR